MLVLNSLGCMAYRPIGLKPLKTNTFYVTRLAEAPGTWEIPTIKLFLDIFREFEIDKSNGKGMCANKSTIFCSHAETENVLFETWWL